MQEKRAERLQHIVSTLRNGREATIRQLSSMLLVSEMTVRRDLEVLDKQGIIRLFHGNVVYNEDRDGTRADGEYSLVSAATQHVAEKTKIAKAACGLIEDGDVLILDTGSTVEVLARTIPREMNVTIICYSLTVLEQVARMPNMRLILAGGYFHRNTLMFESPQGIDLIRSNRASKAFLAAVGVNPRLGVTCRNSYERDTKRTALDSSLTKILVVDSSKFDIVAPVHYANVSDFDVVVTDEGIDSGTASEIEKRGVKLIIAGDD